MRRLPLLALTVAALAAGTPTAAHASTICVDDICVCTHEYRCLLDQPAGDPVCVRVDIDNDGHYETICVP